MPYHLKQEGKKGFIMHHIDEGPAFASDHQPVLSILN
jgi:hypothetical protein